MTKCPQQYFSDLQFNDIVKMASFLDLRCVYPDTKSVVYVKYSKTRCRASPIAKE